jgi:hypothetical protein
MTDKEDPEPTDNAPAEEVASSPYFETLTQRLFELMTVWYVSMKT